MKRKYQKLFLKKRNSEKCVGAKKKVFWKKNFRENFPKKDPSKRFWKKNIPKRDFNKKISNKNLFKKKYQKQYVNFIIFQRNKFISHILNEIKLIILI